MHCSAALQQLNHRYLRYCCARAMPLHLHPELVHQRAGTLAIDFFGALQLLMLVRCVAKRDAC